MTNLSAITRKVQKLEDVLLPKEKKPTGPDIDYEFFTQKEKAISDTIHLFHDIAVRLGHGDLSACKYHIPIEYDPNFCFKAREEALMNATPEELKRINLESEIIEKWIHLIALLTDNEKDAIKQYNSLSTAKKWNWDYPEKEYEETRLLYEQIMTKYEAKSYEDSDMKPYEAGSGIPLDVLRKMDSTFAEALEKRLLT